MKEAILVAGSAKSTGSLDSKDVLANGLVLESLIFVAFSFSYTLAQPTQGGRHPFFARGWFAWVVTGVIAAVAASAGAAWWQIYHQQWPDDVVGWIEAAGLGAGIVAQPIFAAIVTTQARN